MSNIYIAFDKQPIENWQDHVIVPTYSSHWKPETIAKKQQEYLDGYGDKAPNELPTGNVVSLSVKSEGSDGVVTSPLKGEFPVMKFPDSSRLIGIDTRHELRLCAWSLRRQGAKVPLWLWDVSLEDPSEDGVWTWGGLTVVNLYSLSGAKASSIPLDAWLNAWGFPLVGTSKEQVVVIEQIAKSMGF